MRGWYCTGRKFYVSVSSATEVFSTMLTVTLTLKHYLSWLFTLWHFGGTGAKSREGFWEGGPALCAFLPCRKLAPSGQMGCCFQQRPPGLGVFPGRSCCKMWATDSMCISRSTL